jgi:hypothetical protein
MADWSTISSLATAVATLMLAVATFASVRSARRAAVATERALLAGIRPVLVSSRQDDPPQKVGFADEHWVHVDGVHAVAEATDEAVYFAIGLRNVGNGLALLDGWDFYDERADGQSSHRDPADFRRLTRDIYVPAGDVGFWQGAYREPGEESFKAASNAIEERRTITIDLLYGDHEGDQRTVSRFVLTPGDEEQQWLATVSRHWNLDRANPR